MQKTVLTYGIISGLIVVALWHATRPLWMEDGQIDMSTSMIYGYINMIVALSMVFMGIKQYRDRYGDGKITFGKGLKIGLLITVIAAAFYVAGWMIYYETGDVAETFADHYISGVKAGWEQKGMAQADIDAKVEKLQDQMEAYNNNFLMRIAFTFMEIFPVGLIISLISAFILKRRVSPGIS